jgi:hypothetical protein
MPAEPLCYSCVFHAELSELECGCLYGMDEEHRIACIDDNETRTLCSARKRSTPEKRGYWIARAVKFRMWRSRTAPFHVGDRMKAYRPAKNGKRGRGGRREKGDHGH